MRASLPCRRSSSAARMPASDAPTTTIVRISDASTAAEATRVTPSAVDPLDGMTRIRFHARWYELLPEIVLGAGLLFFVVDQTDPARSAFRSAQAVAIMVGIGAAWLGGRVLLGRLVP